MDIALGVTFAVLVSVVIVFILGRIIDRSAD
jgi:hypothetical protein